MSKMKKSMNLISILLGLSRIIFIVIMLFCIVFAVYIIQQPYFTEYKINLLTNVGITFIICCTGFKICTFELKNNCS